MMYPIRLGWNSRSGIASKSIPWTPSYILWCSQVRENCPKLRTADYQIAVVEVGERNAAGIALSTVEAPLLEPMSSHLLLFLPSQAL